MKLIANLFIAVFFLLTFSGASFSQTKTANETRLDKNDSAIVKSDFKQVDAVAHVRVLSFEIADSIGSAEKKAGYYLYRLKAEVVESFKGGLEKGKTIDFYLSAEMQYPQANLTGEKIVFLEKINNRETKEKRLFQLENSGRPATEAYLSEVRKLKRKK